MYLLSIVIPVHEEGSYILATLERITRSVKTEFECIIIADDKSDSTIPFILDFQHKDPRFRFELNQIAVGPAGAIKQGIRLAKGEMIAVVSGDGSDDISQLDSLAGLVERGVSVAVASRYMKGGQLVGAPLLKAWLSRLAGITLYIFARLGTRDATNNFKVYSNEFINSIVIESNHGFEIGLELTTKAKLLNFRIAEIPTIWIERTEGESKFPLISSLRFYLKWYLKAIFRIKPQRI
jgi:glycosyltransferase involved in cell wall biosynthesis